MFAALGFADKAKNPSEFTAAELKQLDVKCQEEFKLSFADTLKKVMEEATAPETLSEEHTNMLVALFGKETPPEGKQGAAEITALKNTVEAQQQTIENLEKEAEPEKPKKVTAKLKIVPITGGSHTDKHLFGIEHEMFAMCKPWNAVALTRQPLIIIGATRGFSGDWSEYETELRAEVNKYGKSLSGRMAQLQGEGKLAAITMQDIDFTGFDGTGWGEQYIVRRQDALIAYIRTLNSVSKLFSTRYNVQNKEILSNAFLSHFSGAFQPGRYFKGAVSVEPMEAGVFDLMIKHKFENLKQLEKEYIGYLNREGSDPMKWTWIEWMVARILEIAMNEWNERRIMGYRIEPTVGIVGHHLQGSDGLFRKLRMYASAPEFRLKPVTGFTYTKATMLASVEGFVENIFGYLPSLKGLRLHVNEKHLPWYTASYRAAYGVQFDFTGSKLSIMNYPDVELVGIPNMGNKTCMILTAPGNIELYENVPGEMAKIGMQRDLEELMIFSYFKEGIGAYMVGKKHTTQASLDLDNYQNQYIFFTDDTIASAADVTTVDATKGDWFKSIANSVATTITDITSAVDGVVYRLICGSAANASKTIKAAKFADVNAWTPTAVGDYLEVYYNAATSKFVEVARLVS